MSAQPSKTPLAGDRRTGVFSCLQGGRAIAALLVILYHNTLYIFAKDKYWGFDPTHRLLNFSHAGVEFFFVLSGFIILHAHWADLGRPAQFLSFARKRFIRIYPLYWLVLMAIVPVYFIVPSYGFSYHRDPMTILSSVLLVFFSKDMISELPVAWTLHYEVLFYFIFALAILNKRLGFIMGAAWLLAAAASFAAGPYAFPWQFIASPLHLLFAMGMAACLVLRHYRISAPMMLAIAGLGLFLAAGLEEDYSQILSEHARDMLYGLGSMLMLIGLVELERSGRLRTPQFLQLMGNASYSIYLIHFPLLSALAKILIHFGAKSLPVAIPFILLPVLTVGCGITVHLLIERPLQRALSQGFARKPMMMAQAA